MPDRLTPADGDRNPLEALADVSCQHTRHYAMCASCACAAVRPELERLRARVETLLMDGASEGQRADEAEREAERLRAKLDRVHGLHGRHHRALAAVLGCTDGTDWDGLAATAERLRAELAEAKADSNNLRSRLHHANTAAVQAEAVIARAERLRDKWLTYPTGDMHHAAGLMLAKHLSGEAFGSDASTAPESRPANSKEILSGSGSAPESPQDGEQPEGGPIHISDWLESERSRNE